MADHDQRLKTLLQVFFVEFIRLFFAAWAERFDFSSVEWLPTEVFPDPPQGERRALDLVAQLPVRQSVEVRGEENWVVMLHVEIESSDSVVQFRPRMFEYYWMLRLRYGLPVLPIGLFLRVGLDGIGWDVYEESFWEHRLIHFEYAYVGLPALNAVEYLSGENLLGVALTALMAVPDDRRAWLKAKAMTRLVDSLENDYRRFLLCGFVQAYMPLEGPQLEEFDHMLQTEKAKGPLKIGSTWFEDGQRLGQCLILQKQLEKRFGPLSSETLTRLVSMTNEQMEKMAVLLLDAKSLDELDHMLQTEESKGTLEVGSEHVQRLTQRLILYKQLEKHFGPLSPRILARLTFMTSAQIDRIAVLLLDAKSLDELGLGEDWPA